MEHEITDRCIVTCGGYNLDKITDGDLNTCWTGARGHSTVNIDLPEGEKACGMLIEWNKQMKQFECKQFNAEGIVIVSSTDKEYFKNYVTWFDFDENTVRAEIKVYDKTVISDIHVYSTGESNPEIQKWKNPPEKADIMLVVTHQDDEVLWFGGLIPYYGVVEDKNVQLVFVTSCGRNRVQEALNCLWRMGIDTLPEFIGYKDAYIEDREEALKLWGGSSSIESSLVKRIRDFQPEVIVTHDYNGEYGHPQHKLVAQCMVSAAKAAANPNKHKNTVKEFGVWEVKKVYLHLSNTGTIYMDWDTPYEALGMKTPLQVAEEGYQEHKSQLLRYSMESGKIFDNTKFGLVYTTVGEDVNKNDFLENTDSAL
ncbi:MAG: PIG-L family deacetylase [Clostridia bacterium]|nr:PIG-L family deacetylase [Clostridia bacterium]